MVSLRTKLELFFVSVLCFALLGFGVWIGWKHTPVKPITSGPLLPDDDKEQILIDPIHHTITTLKRGPNNETKKETNYFPDRGETTVSVRDTGDVQIDAQRCGFTFSPRVGFGYGSDLSLRAAIGLDVFYVNRLSGGVGGTSGNRVSSARVGGYLAYNVWSNVSVGPYIDNHRDFGLMFSVRL